MGRAIQSAQLRWIKAFADRSPRFTLHLKSKPSFQAFQPFSVSKNTAYRLRIHAQPMEAADNSGNRQRIPLGEVVADCVNRWFQDTLKEAKKGDASMQVLVGQMYYSGYGVAKDVHKGRAWINRASQNRSSAWTVSDKHPGYNASDSETDDLKEDGKQ